MIGSDNYNCLPLNEFEGNVKISWQALQVEKDFYDVKLACEDKQIKMHRLIISSFSPILRNVLKFNQSPHSLIYLSRVSYRNLQNLLRFMYQGEVDGAEEDLSSFLGVAEDLNVKGLCENNTCHFVSNEEPSEYSYQNNHPTRKRKRTTEDEKTKNINALINVGPITDNINTEIKFKQVTRNVEAKKINNIDANFDNK